MPAAHDDAQNMEMNAQIFASALTAPIPRLYINGFVLGQSLADVAIISQLNGTPNAVLNMSFTSAKSLAMELTKVIDNFEKTMNHTILTIQDIENKTPRTENQK